MQPQATRVEKLILSTLIVLVTATASITVEIRPKTESSLPNFNPLMLTAR